MDNIIVRKVKNSRSMEEQYLWKLLLILGGGGGALGSVNIAYCYFCYKFKKLEWQQEYKENIIKIEQQ